MQTFQTIYNLVSPALYILIGYYLGERGWKGVVSDFGSVKDDVAKVKTELESLKNYVTIPKA